jgi:hypothetical protein
VATRNLSLARRHSGVVALVRRGQGARIPERIRRDVLGLEGRTVSGHTVEKRGAKNLANPDRGRGSGRVFVRVYYRGEGDDLLCFDAGPMGPSGTDTLCRYLGLDEGDSLRRPRDARKPFSPPRCGVLGAEVIGAHERERRRPALGARLVVLPSQVAEQEDA